MCGVAGIYSPGRKASIESLGQMIGAMAHRGPDDRGTQLLAEGELALGHLRLSILDLSALGHQPMATPDRRTWITYNGEVYNFREIRADLEERGFRFRSDSDTEVILAAYRQWGLPALERFRGMFAFALWDEARNELHLCRDRFGVKPLYYSLANGVLAFASESKALNVGGHTSRTVDPLAVAEFVRCGYISSPRSIFADVRVVPPGTVCTFDAALKLREREYWSARTLFEGEPAEALRRELRGLSPGALLERIESSLQRAFEYRMVADVPVGLFLSGGIDSSLVAALLAKRSGFDLKTFTIGYGASEFDETSYARTVAHTLGAEHVEFVASPHAALDTAVQIPEIADEPIGDSSLIPTLMVSKLARQHVKVALSADGADELFGGYARYRYCGDFIERGALPLRALYWLSAEVLERLPPRLIASAYTLARARGSQFAAIGDKLRKFVRMAKARAPFDAYEAVTSEWSRAQCRGLLAHPAEDLQDARATFQSIAGRCDPRDRLMHYDMTRYLPGDLLVKVDRASMSVSLEAREPFLDHEAAALAAALPMEWKVQGRRNKRVLRELLCGYFPASLFERPKHGFSAPVREWLRGPLREIFVHELAPARVRQFGILDEQAVQRATSGFLSSDHPEVSPAGAWILLQLSLWAGRWMRPQAVEPVAGLEHA